LKRFYTDDCNELLLLYKLLFIILVLTFRTFSDIALSFCWESSLSRWCLICHRDVPKFQLSTFTYVLFTKCIKCIHA
jgi:hypothetical protein